MKSARQVGAVLLLLVSYLTPAMACMTSSVRMNAEEQACCRAMKNQCEHMGMPASHGCCRKVPQAHNNALETKAATYHPIAATTVWLAAFECFHPAVTVTGWVDSANYSPPHSPPGSTSILRI